MESSQNDTKQHNNYAWISPNASPVISEQNFTDEEGSCLISSSGVSPSFSGILEVSISLSVRFKPILYTRSLLIIAL